MALPAPSLVLRRGVSKQTLAYRAGDEDGLLDLYLPGKMRRARLVVVIHGGAWRVGSKGDAARVGRALAAKGFAAACVNYRKLPGVTVAQSAQDVAEATAWLLSRADEYGLDDRRFALIGHSSGGHLAAFLAADPAPGKAACLDMSRLRAVITLDGVFDLRGPRYDGQLRELDEGARAAVSPLLMESPPGGVARPAYCLIHTGSNSEPRFGEDAVAYGNMLRARGLDVSVHYAADAHHRSVAGQFGEPDLPMAGWAAECLRRALGA